MLVVIGMFLHPAGYSYKVSVNALASMVSSSCTFVVAIAFLVVIWWSKKIVRVERRWLKVCLPLVTMQICFRS